MGKIKYIVVAITMMFCCVLLSGCATVHMGFTFEKDGTITSRNEFISKSSMAKDKIAEEKAKDQKDGYTIKDTGDGYIATKTIENVQRLVYGGAPLWNPPEQYAGVQMRKGLLYDYYSLDLFKKGEKSNIPKANNQVNVPTSLMHGKNGLVRYLDARNKAEEEAKSLNQIEDNLTQAAIDSMQLDLNINVPYSVDSSNADQVQNDGKTLIWNLKPAFMDNKDLNIQAKFRIYHEDTIKGLVVLGVIGLICAIVLLVLGLIAKDNPVRRKRFIGIAAVLFVAIIAFAGYAKYSIDNPPTLSAKDKIVLEKGDNSTTKTPETSAAKNNAQDKIASTQDDNGKAAAEVFKKFHSSITSHDFQAAYQLYSADYQAKVPYDGWAKGYATTVASEPTNVEVTQADSNHVSLKFGLRATDNINGKKTVQSFAGTCSMIKVGDNWKIDEITATKK